MNSVQAVFSCSSENSELFTAVFPDVSAGLFSGVSAGFEFIENEVSRCPFTFLVLGCGMDTGVTGMFFCAGTGAGTVGEAGADGACPDVLAMGRNSPSPAPSVLGEGLSCWHSLINVSSTRNCLFVAAR